MINIIKNRKVPFIVSGAVFLTSVVLLLTLGLKPGIDFTGGTLMEVSFTGERPTLDEMQAVIETQDLGGFVVQPSNEDGFLIKTQFLTEEAHQEVLGAIRAEFEGDEAESGEEPGSGLVITDDQGNEMDAAALGFEFAPTGDRVIEERIETIGPSISAELARKSWQVGIAVILAIIFFVAYAFRKVTRPVASWKYGVTAIIALVHDVVITMGVFVILGYYLGVEVDIPFVVAMLTILGYSVNDTIVVFDRVREKLLKRGRDNFAETVNTGVNETIPRSINTSITTLLVLTALFVFGGASIKFFALALMIGVALGTYSSIFLASPLLVEWERAKRRR